MSTTLSTAPYHCLLPIIILLCTILLHKSLSGNNIEHYNVRGLADGLKANSTLRHLECVHARTDDGRAALWLIGSCLTACAVMRVLGWAFLACSLASNKIKREGARFLAEALKVNATLESLVFVAAGLRTEEGHVFSLTPAALPCIGSLRYDENRIGDAGAIALCDALVVNSSLKMLECVCVAIVYIRVRHDDLHSLAWQPAVWEPIISDLEEQKR